MHEAKIQFCIPTYNNANEIDKTIESIFSQEFKAENIFVSVMDFGSSDGTYEKILKYCDHRFGVYQDKRPCVMRRRVARMQQVMEYVGIGGTYCYNVVMYPGDIVYPDFASTCSDIMIKHAANSPVMVICETDLFDKDGHAVHQKPLFDSDRCIDGENELYEYIRMGFDHQVQVLGLDLRSDMNDRYHNQGNERVWWNKMAIINMNRYSYYVREPLACQHHVKYDNELEEILLRWDSLIGIQRAYEAKYCRHLDDVFMNEGQNNLARYSMWRSYLIKSEMKQLTKEAEDCFLVAGIINPDIKEKLVYHELENFLKSDICEDDALLKCLTNE